MAMRVRAFLLVLIALAAMPLGAQFDYGGGSSQPAWSSFKLNPKTRIKLDFHNASIDMVLSLFQKTSGVTIIKDPSLTGPITVTSAGPVSIGEAFNILNTVLGMKGYELKKEDNLLVVRQKQQRGGASGFGTMTPEQLTAMMGASNTQLKVYMIKYANASQVARVINDVFATTQNPLDQLQQLFGGGNAGGGFGGGAAGRPGVGGGQGNRGQGGNNPFAGNTGGGNRGQGRFGRGFGTTQAVVRASSDDFSNSVIVNAPTKEQGQVAELISQIDKQSEEPQKPKVFRLEYASADDLAPVVQNVLVSNAPRGRGGIGTQNVPIEQRFQQALRFGSAQSAFGQVVADARTNSLVVTATDENLEIIDKVIKELDQPVEYQASTFVFPLDNARADDIATLLNQAFGTRTGTNFGAQNRNTQGRTNQNQNLNQNRNNGNRNPGGGGLGNLGGNNLQNQVSSDGKELELALENPDVDAGELMTEVSVSQGGGFGQIFGQRRPNQQNSGQTTGRDAQGRLVNVKDLSGQVTTIPDQNTNSIIVVTTPENAELIKQILAQLDKIPEQVMIETVIVEATLDASSKLGVEWKFTQDKAFGQPNTTGSGSTDFGLGTTPPAQGFRYTLTGSDFSVFLNALKTDQKFEVLSTPRIFTSNNTQAQINISQSVPYVLSQREDANGNLTFNYAFQDVGIVLTVTPRITANGYVTMDVSQTANDLQGYTSFNAPIVNQRQAQTTVSVKDGETIILGGIIRNTVSSTVKKVPLLGDIPLLGNLFKSTDKSNVKTELLVFLTPRVVRDPADAQKLKEEQQKQLTDKTQKTIEKALPKPPVKKQDPPKKDKDGGQNR